MKMEIENGNFSQNRNFSQKSVKIGQKSVKIGQKSVQIGQKSVKNPNFQSKP